MKDCMCRDPEGICMISCKICPGSTCHICKHYVNGYCELTGLMCTCSVGCKNFRKEGEENEH